MKGLLYKDIRILKKKSRMMLLFCVVYLVWALLSEEMSGITNIFGLILPMLVSTTIAYDTANRWPQFAATLPLSHNQVVRAKYYLLGGLASLGFVLVTVCQLLCKLRFPNLDLKSAILAAVLLAFVGILVNAALIPLVYRFGAERARIFGILIGAILAAVIMLVLNAGNQMILTSIFEQPQWLWGLGIGFVVFVVVMTWISYRLSCRFYSRHAMG